MTYMPDVETDHKPLEIGEMTLNSVRRPVA